MIRKFLVFLFLCGTGGIVLNTVPVEGMMKFSQQAKNAALAQNVQSIHVDLINNGYSWASATLTVLDDIYSWFKREIKKDRNEISSLKVAKMRAKDENERQECYDRMQQVTVKLASEEKNFPLAVQAISDFISENSNYYKTEKNTVQFRDLLNNIVKDNEITWIGQLIVKEDINRKNNEPYYYITREKALNRN